MGSFSSKYLKDIWNLPNILTMLRLVLIPVFAGLFLAGYEKWALAVFIIIWTGILHAKTIRLPLSAS